MSARDRFREAEKQSMKAYNRRPAVTPLTDIDRNIQINPKTSQPFNRSDRLIRGQDTQRGYSSGSRFQTSPDDDLYPSKGPVPNIRYTPRQYADMNSGSRSAFTVLENEAEPLSFGKGLVESPWGGDPFPKSRTSAAIQNDNISMWKNLAQMETMEDERMRLQDFNRKRDELAAARNRIASLKPPTLPTDLQGISELFGDTEMGFDFLRRSNFSDKMQAGLRDKRPMSEYISYENIRPSGEYQRDSNYQASSPSEALSMQTPETFGNTGVIRIEERMTPKKQEEVLYHEFLHKGDISRRQKVDGLIPGSSSSFGPFGVADHKAIAAESNRAFSDSYNRNDMRTEMIHNVSAGYLDRSERNQIAQKAIDAIAAERGLGENLFKSDLQNKKEMDDLVLTVHDAMGSPMSESAFIRMADIKGLSDAEVRTVFNQFNDFMADSVSEREADKNRNVEMLKAAENFSARFAKGGIISALMEGK